MCESLIFVFFVFTIIVIFFEVNTFAFFVNLKLTTTRFQEEKVTSSPLKLLLPTSKTTLSFISLSVNESGLHRILNSTQVCDSGYTHTAIEYSLLNACTLFWLSNDM